MGNFESWLIPYDIVCCCCFLKTYVYLSGTGVGSGFQIVDQSCFFYIQIDYCLLLAIPTAELDDWPHNIYSKHQLQLLELPQLLLQGRLQHQLTSSAPAH